MSIVLDGLESDLVSLKPSSTRRDGAAARGAISRSSIAIRLRSAGRRRRTTFACSAGAIMLRERGRSLARSFWKRSAPNGGFRTNPRAHMLSPEPAHLTGPTTSTERSHSARRAVAQERELRPRLASWSTLSASCEKARSLSRRWPRHAEHELRRPCSSAAVSMGRMRQT